MPPVCRRVPALLSAVFAAAAIACSVPAIAAPASQTGQVPGYYRQPVGQFTVTALYDGHVELSPQLLHGIKPEEIQARIARMFQTQSSKGVPTAVNGFLSEMLSSADPSRLGWIMPIRRVPAIASSSISR